MNKPYEPPPFTGNCRHCFDRGWFLLPNANGSSTPTKCDKCPPKLNGTPGVKAWDGTCARGHCPNPTGCEHDNRCRAAGVEGKSNG